MASSPSAVMQAYTPPLSLWSLIEQHVPSFELEEIKSILGSNIVDQSLELHSEIEMLLDIWRDMRDEIQENKLVQSRLPEPPHQRERLIQEINFFAESIKDRARRKDIDPKNILKNHNNNVIDYASDASRPGSSMGRASRSSDGRETPMMVASPDRVLKAYEVTDEVEAVSGKLTVDKFDDVCAHLRSTLETEVERLLADIEFLQDCLDSEANVRDSIDTPQISREPTLTELREERMSLERELLLTDNLTYTPQVDKPAFNDALKKPLLANPLSTPVKAAVRATRQSPVLTSPPNSSPRSLNREVTPPSSARNSSRIGSDFPLKAVHDVSFTKTQKHNSNDVNSSSLKSKAFSRDSTSTSFMPSPPKVLTSKPNPPRATSTSQTSSLSDVAQATHLSRTSEQNPAPKIHRGRRTVSPGRVRVVDLSNIVGSHASKGDSVTSVGEGIQDLNVTNPLLPFNPVPPTSAAPSVESGLRPRSADRFRKMVMGCRDGE